MFPQLPAKQYDFSLNLAGEIEEASIDIFDLNSGRVDLGQGVAGVSATLYVNAATVVGMVLGGVFATTPIRLSRSLESSMAVTPSSPLPGLTTSA